MAQKKTLKIKAPKPDRHLEECFITSCMLTGIVYPVPTEGFTEPTCKEIYQAMFALEEKSELIDMATIYGQLKKMRSNISPHYLGTLWNDTLPFVAGGVPESVSLHYWQAFLQYAKQRVFFLHLLGELAGDFDEIDQKIVSLEKKIEDIKALASTKTASNIRAIVKETIASIESGESTGKSTGLPCLDKSMLGWHKGDLNIICGRPGSGKTSLMLTSIYETIKRHKHLVFSLEMTRQQLAIRLACMKTKLPYMTVLNVARQKDKEELWDMVMPAFTEIANSDLVILDDNKLTLFDFEAVVKSEKPDIVWVDHLSLLHNAMPEQRFQNREREIATYTSFFKSLAKKYMVPVNLLCQLNRSAATEGRRPKLHDLRDSGAIEQDADHVIATHALVENGLVRSDKDSREILLLKGRNIPTNNFKVKWDGDAMKFYEEYPGETV